MRRGVATAVGFALGLLTVAAEAALNLDPKTYWPPYILIGSAGLIWDALGYFYFDRRQGIIIQYGPLTISGDIEGVRPDYIKMNTKGTIIKFKDSSIERPSADPLPVFLVAFAVIFLVVLITWLVT